MLYRQRERNEAEHEHEVWQHDLDGTTECLGDGSVEQVDERPDATPAIRADFAAAGFDEVAFVAPEGTVMTVGHHRLTGAVSPFDPGRKLFDFVGDGFMPA